MSHILVRPENIVGNHFTLSGPEAHHVIRVLRKKVGDPVELFDGKGQRFSGTILDVSPDLILCNGVITQTLPSLGNTPQVHLFQGLPKGSKFDYVIEKATELGVYAIHPFLSRKNIIQLDSSAAQKKVGRWSKVAEAAAKQSGHDVVPAIHSPVSLTALSDVFQKGETWVFHLGEGGQLFHSFLTEEKKPDLVNIVIGPESGFAEDEVQWLKKEGCAFLHLGRRVLRSETAGLAILSVLNHVWEK